jgi:hypothetical protein
VGQKLGPLLDAPLPSTPYAQGWAQAFSSSLMGKLAASALVVAAAAVWLSHVQPQRVPEPAAEAPAVAPAAPPDAPVGQPSVAELPQPEPAVQDLAPTTAAAQTHATPPMGEARAPGPGMRAPAQRRPSPRTSARRPRVGPAAMPARTAADALADSAGVQDTGEQEAAASASAEAPPAPVAPEAPAPEPPAAPLKREVDLLFAARRELRTQPNAALRLLDEHAELFPGGMLAPEREILAIDALRKLGRDAEAEQRLARFRARYPDSPHLRGAR